MLPLRTFQVPRLRSLSRSPGSEMCTLWTFRGCSQYDVVELSGVFPGVLKCSYVVQFRAIAEVMTLEVVLRAEIAWCRTNSEFQRILLHKNVGELLWTELIQGFWEFSCRSRRLLRVSVKELERIAQELQIWRNVRSASELGQGHVWIREFRACEGLHFLWSSNWSSNGRGLSGWLALLLRLRLWLLSRTWLDITCLYFVNLHLCSHASHVL